MPYSQQQLIDLIKTGDFSNEKTMLKHIETLISNLFIFENKVYKIYKDKKFVFNNTNINLANKNERFEFTEQDFNWNKTTSPTIHLGLKYVSIVDDRIIEADRSQAEEIIIVMNRVNTSDILFERLISGVITESDCYEIGKQLAQKLSAIQIEILPKVNFLDFFIDRINDVKDWMQNVSQFIPAQDSREYIGYLEKYAKTNELWFKEQSEDVVIDGDFHCHNVLFLNGELDFIDTYPPIKRWIVGHKFFPVYRIATDIWALSGQQSYFEAILLGYEDTARTKLDRKMDKFFITYSASIAMPYLYVLSEKDSSKKEPADKFKQFFVERFNKEA